MPDAEIQLICRWMCPESLHIYRRMGTTEHERLVTLASRATVDLIQANNAPRVDADQGYAQLLRDMSGPHGRAYANEFARNTATAPTAVPTVRAPQHPRTLPPAPHGEAAITQPAPPAVEVGATVLVPSWLWPDYACAEHGGRGWEALVRAVTRCTATVRFAHAHSGVCYADERLPLHVLQPLARGTTG